FTGDLRNSLLALALPMPGLIVQDTWRTAFFSHRRGSWAFANDLMWAAAQVILVGVVWFTGHRTAPMFVLAWGGAANVAALFGFLQARIVPRPFATLRWLRSMRDLSPRFLVEFVARIAANAGSLYMAGAFGGLSAAGALRGAQVVLGPMNILNMGITAPAITEAVHLSKRSLQRMLRFAVMVGGGLALASIVFGVGMFFLPDRFGQALLRHSWRPAHHVILAY